MVTGTASEPIEEQARQLAAALDVIEAQLDALALGADPDVVARALAEPVRVFDAAARGALREGRS